MAWLEHCSGLVSWNSETRATWADTCREVCDARPRKRLGAIILLHHSAWFCLLHIELRTETKRDKRAE